MTLRPLNTKNSYRQNHNEINNMVRKLNKDQISKAYGGTDNRVIIGKLPTDPEKYGLLFYLNGTPHIVITAEDGMVAAEPGTDVLTLI